MFDYKMITR